MSMKLQTRQQPKGFLNSETSAQLLHGCSAADPRRRRSAYAAILWYTNRPYGHQMRHTKRLIIMLLFGLAGNEYPLLGDVVGRSSIVVGLGLGASVTRLVWVNRWRARPGSRRASFDGFTMVSVTEILRYTGRKLLIII